MRAPKPLWTPSPERVERANVTRFAHEQGLGDLPYEELWRWSVADLDRFWAAIWRTYDVRADGDPATVLASRAMPSARWFPDVRVNFAEHVFRDRDPARPALHFASETRALDGWTWGELERETARMRGGLAERGVGPGDRVAALLPNAPETVAAFLATASLGAVWSSAAPEFGARSVIDRFGQIEPTVLLAIDGYRYGGRDFDRRAVAREVGDAIGAPVVHTDALGHAGAPVPPLEFARMPFDHPLWILYSSGTTGLPKAIVHGHGGILLEHLKKMHLHLDAQAGDRVFWFTTTGWMMWNFLVGVLLTEAEVVLYDGSPAGTVLWDLAAEAGITTFGVGAAWIAGQQKEGIEPARGRDLSRLDAVGSTGSPLAPEGFAWVYDQLGADTWLFSTSGGTDVCTAFVGGVPTLPVHAGELQARALGADVQAWDDDGRPLTDAVGELVIAQPLPSMPTRFWNDPDGTKLHDAYFAHFPGAWRHGDWITITDRGSAVISGRSDSTINRGGVRMGTSEIYRAVLALDEVVDALVVDVDGWMPLFVVLRDGLALDDALIGRIAARVREDCSPRHVPDVALQVAQVPRTLSGKALEVPVKRILQGRDPAEVVSRESLADATALDPFVAFAADRASRREE